MNDPIVRPQWRSLEDLADTPEFRRHALAEFPEEFSDPDPVSRRQFLGVMGAALALAGTAGCRRPLAKILPYARMPEEILPGIPLRYATVMPFRGVGEGILVTSNEGRPTKIEGNPSHPSSLGGTHVWAQASILELYDPDRAKTPTQGGAQRTWSQFQDWLGERRAALSVSQGEGLRFLAEPTSSPSATFLRDEILRAFPAARFHVWEPINRDQPIQGSRLAFGAPLRTQLFLDQADVILSLDADFLFGEMNAVRHARDFASRRRVTDEHDGMNRLYAVESTLSATGAMADHRLRLSFDRVAEWGAALVGALAERGVLVPGYETAAIGRRSATWDAEASRWLAAVAADLAEHRGRAVVLVGRDQPAALHALGHAVNHALAAVGPIVRYTEEPIPGAQTESLRQLTEDIQAGRVNTLFILGGNPVDNVPADLPLAFDQVEHSVHLSLWHDETSERCSWHLPLAHFLESWGDTRGWDGILSIQQPLIAPLYEGRSELEVLSMILGQPAPDAHRWLQERYASTWGGAFESQWARVLHDGFVPDSAYLEQAMVLQAETVANAWATHTVSPEPGTGTLDLLFRPDHTLWDGRYANNAWLQELPDNQTKITWDNAALLSPATARALGVRSRDMVRLRAGDRELAVVASVSPGLADHTIVLPVGYGRARAGRVGNGVGFHTYSLRTSGTMEIARGVTLAKTGGSYLIATTQDHHVMEGRALVREASLDGYREHPEFARDHHELPTLYTDREYDFTQGNQWGMAIDLNTCIGCNACTVACTSENNVPTVGKDQVHRGREMHWIRLDRYYTGPADNPEAVYQPVPCMHCENAPCESVCPVNATSHSDEGLNEMTYNRCIGTRYCNNNCPYKVRRFGYYDWNRNMTEVEKLGKNPDVTVRMRGMMEKCTYCVQRINRAKITAKNESRPVRDGEIVTACQEVCPTQSIVFGNINDPESRVSRMKAQNRDYALVADLNTRPRTTYQAKLRNRNRDLETPA